MPIAKLGKKTADAATPGPKAYVLYDADLAGFGLRVMPSGVKSWILEYRPHGGGRKAPSRRMVLGRATALTADEARKVARKHLAAIRLGADPAAARQRSREMPTVSEFADTFLKEFCVPPQIKPRTVRLYRDNLKRIAAPHIGSMKLDAVSKADVARMHRRIGKKAPTTANNVLVTIASLFKFAVAEGLLTEGANPARGVARYKPAPKERFLTVEEFARLGEAIRIAETEGLPWRENELADPSKAKHRPKRPEKRTVIVPADVAAVLRLLLFTGCRKGEILGLKWAEVDFERGTLFLDDSKTGRKSVILNAPALEILAALPRVGAFVFPGQSVKEPRGDITGHWYRIRARAGLDGADGKPAVRLHDLRHSFASVGMAGGLGLPIVGKLLGHTQAATTQRYGHLDADPVRKATERIGTAIAGALGEGVTKRDNVRKFPRGGAHEG